MNQRILFVISASVLFILTLMFFLYLYFYQERFDALMFFVTLLSGYNFGRMLRDVLTGRY